MANWFDELGTLELADYDDGVGDVGARRGRGRRATNRGARGRGGAPMRGMARTPARALIPGVPGVPNPGVRIQPLGLGATAFTAASGTLLTLQASPQRPFKGQRLIVDITRTGATSTGLVTISRFDIGTSNQLVGAGSISAGAFAATAFDANVSIDPATPGIQVTLTFNVSAAPGGADRIDVGATLFGTSVG